MPPHLHGDRDGARPQYLWFTGVMTRRLSSWGRPWAPSPVLSSLPHHALELGGIINVLSGASALTYGVVIICFGHRTGAGNRQDILRYHMPGGSYCRNCSLRYR